MDYQIQRNGRRLLVGVSNGYSLMDIETNEKLIFQALALLQEKNDRLRWCLIGKFGKYPVAINYNLDDEVSFFIDGRRFSKDRSESSAIFLRKDEVVKMLTEIKDQHLAPAVRGPKP